MKRMRALVLVAALAASLVAGSDPEPVEPVFGDLSSPIRPGAEFRAGSSGCTYNWVFHQVVYPTVEDPNPVPDVYIGTAAHCTDEIGQRVTVPGTGEIGTVVYDADLVESGSDFALVELDAERVDETNPQMLGFVGPRGYATPDDLALGDRVNLHGFGLLVGNRPVTRSRTGLLTGWNDREYVADMPAVNGDSGGPLLHQETGKALGIISRYGFDQLPPSTDVGPLIPWILDDLAAAGFDDVVLTTID